MTRDEWNQLADGLAESWSRSGELPDGLVIPAGEAASDLTVEPVVRRESDRPTQTLRSAQDDAPETAAVTSIESLVRHVTETQSVVQSRQLENVRPAASTSTASKATDSRSSAAVDALKLAGMITGAGPIITGLIRLFGGDSDDRQASPVPAKYKLPEAVRIEAGLTPGRSLTQVSYAQNDRLRSDMEPRVADLAQPPVNTPPAIQIQVNAMDSRSFMDHSDEIAQAVRTAMLRSHAINDVISEV